MGRLIGRKPDPTPAVAKAVRPHLEPGERVLAGVHLQQPGTTAAQMSGAAGGAVAGALETGVRFERETDPEHRTWREQAAAFGIDATVAQRAVFVSLALTTSRLLLVRRSRLTRRPREVIAAWPLAELDAIAVPRNATTLRVRRGADELTFELPHPHRFLAPVYRELPQRFARAAAR